MLHAVTLLVHLCAENAGLYYRNQSVGTGVYN